MIFCRPCVAGLSFRRRVSVRVFLPLSFLSPLVSPPRRTSPASRAAANIQYTVILAGRIHLFERRRVSIVAAQQRAQPAHLGLSRERLLLQRLDALAEVHPPGE